MINWVKPALVGLGLIATSANAGWFDNEPLSAAADLRYGAALYEFYQDRNLQALSELMVAEARGGIQGHGDNPEIMAGGFYMAYGMKDVAADIFNRLLDPNRPVRTRDAAWFYLGRMRYMQRDFAGAEQALSHLSEAQHKSIANEVKVLRFSLAVKTDQLDKAKAYLNDKSLIRSDWMPYLLFNMGAGYSRAKQWPEGANYFSKLTSMTERSEEHLALYDKAMTAEGYSHLFNKDYSKAIDGFKKVRLDSPLSSRALLGFGWAAFEQQDYNLALMPWQELAKRPLVDANVQEAWVAIAVAHERLGYKNTALSQYSAAEEAYIDEVKRLDQTLLTIKGTAIRSALNIDRSMDFDWLDYAAKNEMAPELIYLVNMFAQDNFLGSVQELRDLLAIQQNFEQWKLKLEFYTDMLDEREFNRTLQINAEVQKTLSLRIADLVKQSDEFRLYIEELKTSDDFLKLVATSEIKRLKRIQDAEKNLALLLSGARDGMTVMPPEELTQLAETTRIHKGVLMWQAAMMQNERLARANKQLSLVDAQLVNIQDASGRIRNIAGRGYDLQPYRVKIIAAQQSLVQQSNSIETAIENAQNALRNRIQKTLGQERKRLMQYIGQARLSSARLLDSTLKSEAANDESNTTEEDSAAINHPEQQSSEPITDSDPETNNNPKINNDSETNITPEASLEPEKNIGPKTNTDTEIDTAPKEETSNAEGESP